MNDDYLWDKSGEPDPEIQELENILAPLRYQPTPLELPDDVVVRRKWNYFPLLAIAATVLIALLAAGVWLRVRTEKSTPPQEQAKSVPSVPSVYKETATPEVVQKKVIRKRSYVKRRESQEAIAAKEQVMLALRLASEKLKLAQKQMKSPHKIG
ncbi:MAG TPA: hypothetical protein VFS76_26710 [Pyrinomonadaceae bacterium]|nr:hypothetical protein [Pyrinomonadaceae bacterium]